MELLLNFAWFAIAGAALWSFARIAWPDRKQLLCAISGLGCALLLLFPVISVSDDLHLQTAAVEDSGVTKRVLSVAVHANPVSHLVWFCFWLSSILFARPRRSSWFMWNGSGPQYSSPILLHFRLGRAPPADRYN